MPDDLANLCALFVRRRSRPLSSLELERSTIQGDGTLTPWNGITANVNQIGANVYNAAALVSPIRQPGGAPRFLLLGGQIFTGTPPGALSSAVYYNNAP